MHKPHNMSSNQTVISAVTSSELTSFTVAHTQLQVVAYTHRSNSPSSMSSSCSYATGFTLLATACSRPSVQVYFATTMTTEYDHLLNGCRIELTRLCNSMCFNMLSDFTSMQVPLSHDSEEIICVNTKYQNFKRAKQNFNITDERLIFSCAKNNKRKTVYVLCTIMYR